MQTNKFMRFWGDKKNSNTVSKSASGVMYANKNYVCLKCKKQINAGDSYYKDKVPYAKEYRHLCLSCKQKILDSL